MTILLYCKYITIVHSSRMLMIPHIGNDDQLFNDNIEDKIADETASNNYNQLLQKGLYFIDCYQRLMAATDHLEDVIKPIEEYNLSKLNLLWWMMNQYLYHSLLYSVRTKQYQLLTTSYKTGLGEVDEDDRLRLL